MENGEKKRPTIGVCLGSGAMRGLAHVGVLEVFEENEIPIDMVSGCSMGSVVGSLFCCGISPYTMRKIALHLDQRSLMDVTVPRVGLLRGKQIQSILMTLTQNKGFEDTNIPFYALATDLNTAKGVMFSRGKLHEAVRASISIPGVFHPHHYEGRTLVDGGVVERVPLDILHQNGADVVLGVDVGYRGEGHPKVDNLFAILMASMDIMDWEMNRQKVYAADFMIVPDVRHINPMVMDQAEDCMEQGRIAAMEAVPAIKEIINQHCAAQGMEPMYPESEIQQDKIELLQENLQPAQPTAGETLEEAPQDN